VPWLAPCLQSIADLRDFDDQVMDAARAAADSGLVYYTEHNDAEYIEVNESVEFERRMQTTAPPGWKPFQVKPEQPSATYIAYRDERLREPGRPVGMPLMTIKLDSSKHNFSSARFDSQLYQRGVVRLQRWLERVCLNRFLREVMKEAALQVPALKTRPKRVEFVWTWPVPPVANPNQEALAQTTRMQNGTLTYAAACAENGLDWEQTIAQRKREREALAAAGLPTEPQTGNQGKPADPPQGKDKSEEKTDTDTEADDA
jgi:capsid protein